MFLMCFAQSFSVWNFVCESDFNMQAKTYNLEVTNIEIQYHSFFMHRHKLFMC